MKNRLFRIALVAYVVALSVLGIIHMGPALTENAWNPATLYLLQAVVVGLFILASGMLAVDFYCMFRSFGLLRMPGRKREDPVQSHILRHAEDLYRQQGYCNQGSFGAGHIALQFSVDEKDPLVQDAMLALVESGKLVPLQTPTGTAYALPAKRQMEMITDLDLSSLWEFRGGRYHPNDVLIGEIQRVKSAVAARQRQETNS